MLEINFQQIRPYHGGLTDAFEELCCQIFHRLSDNSIPNFQPPQGSQFQRFRGAGGDGGVEALWILPNGDKWGLQAKYFDKLENSQLRQLQKSLKTAIKNHPELTRYIFCISFNFTGKTGRGEGEIDELETWKKEQLKDLANQNINISIEFWTESVLRNYLLTVDTGGGLRRYWFDHEVMTKDWLQKRLNDAKVQAGQRYSPKLSVNVPAFDALEAFACQNAWKEQVDKYLQEFNENIQQWHSHVKNANELPENSHQIVKNITNQLISLQSLLGQAIYTKFSINLKEVSLQINHLIQNTKEVEKTFDNDFKQKYGKNADGRQFRQFHAEYQCDFPAAKLDTTRDLLKCLDKIDNLINSPEYVLPRSQFMLLRGSVGIGKTHAIVDHALHISKTGQICLVFYGEDFTGDEPWKIMVNKLGLSGNISRDEIWGMIDSAAEATEKCAIIYIDAINEPSPVERRRWKKSWLAPLCQQITNFPRLKLCVSCPDTYLDEVFDDRNEWIEFEHNGFIGREFDAIKQFFEFYQLEPPATALLQSEFANPLFLHLVCQAIQGLEPRSIPLGIEANQLNDTNPNAIESVDELSNILINNFDNKTLNENQGLLEGLSIILPEKFNAELIDVINDNTNIDIDRYKLLTISASGLQWRTIESLSERTEELIYGGLYNSNCSPTILDSLFGIAVIPNHPLNAEFINNLLEQQDLTTRDPFWCASLYEDFEKQKGAWRLIEWSLKADLSSFSEETSSLWALFLSWCCAASDRRVRDRLQI
ncbi:MAG: hypothetical protein HEQ27_04650 [Dolichospermum sp. JUN01]|nr:hypothetical protein [Dolichospermum sp. JUN01]